MLQNLQLIFITETADQGGMGEKSRKQLCRNCRRLLYGRSEYLSHRKLCISMNEYRLLPLSLRSVFRKRSSSLESRRWRMSWHGSPGRNLRCGDPYCDLRTPSKVKRRVTSPRSTVLGEVSLQGSVDSPLERSVLGNLSTNSTVEEGSSPEGAVGQRRCSRKEVNYFCKPCNQTLASWQTIRRHLLSSQHLLITSPERAHQIANTAKRKRLAMPFGQALSLQGGDKEEVATAESIHSQESSGPVKYAARVRIDYHKSAPKSYSICKPGKTSSGTKDDVRGRTKENSQEKVSQGQAKVVPRSGKESEGHLKVVPRSESVECKERKSPFVAMGHRCDSMEFLRNATAGSEEQGEILPRKVLWTLFLNREKIWKEKVCSGKSRWIVGGQGREGTMIRYDYKKTECPSGLLSDGKEMCVEGDADEAVNSGCPQPSKPSSCGCMCHHATSRRSLAFETESK